MKRAIVVLFAVSCAGTDTEPQGTSRASLVATDPVSAAVTGACSTTSVLGLSTQLVDEISCLRPGALTKIDGNAGYLLGDAVFPYLQTPAALALEKAQKTRGVTLRINSALRTIAQQYLLYRWYQTKRCGIGLAAPPGTSNHESALAVDVQDNAAWRSAMGANQLRWLGARDPVHFDYIGEGRIDLAGLSVLAFQRLWNRNHPEDPIAEDGDYGPQTEARLTKSPVGGFTKGADCSQPVPPPSNDPPKDVPVVPDADEEEVENESPAGPADDDGCNGSGRAPNNWAFLLLAMALCWRRLSGR